MEDQRQEALVSADMIATDLVALDAMGGDVAPLQVVRGAIDSVRATGLPVALVGRAPLIEAELRACGAEADRHLLPIIDVPDVIAMDEHPAHAVRTKPRSSIVRVCELVANGEAAAAVSAGNSGAVLAAAVLVIRRVAGVGRPAIGARVPTANGEVFVLDVGANADCRPEWLAQFASMGDVYAKTMMGLTAPRIGLLSNGVEPGKGSELVNAAAALLAHAPFQFVGNVEGGDIFRGGCDVVVTDGFTGNVVLKAAEGLAEVVFGFISSAARTSLRGKAGGVLLRPKLRPLRARVDYRRTGGALLLGVRGEVVIAHGRSDALAISNAIAVGRSARTGDVSGAIGRAVIALAESTSVIDRSAEAHPPS